MTFLESVFSENNREQKLSKFYQFSVLFGCISLAIVLRLSNYEFVFANLTGHLNFVDTDDYYQLRRLVYFLTHFPSALTFDPLVDWPNGSQVDWMEGHLFLLGLPLKLFGVHSFRGLELGVSGVMISLGLTTILSVYFLSKRIIRDGALTSLVLFFACSNFLLIRFSCLGACDHHIEEALFPPLVLLLSLKAFPEKSKRSAFFLGFLLAFSLMISSSSLFIIGAFFAIYALVLSEKEDWKRFLIVVGTFFFTLLPYAIWCTEIRGDPRSITHASYFHLILILVLAALSFSISRMKKQLRWFLPLILLLLIPAFYWDWPGVLVQPLKEGFAYTFGRTGILQNITEASPLFMELNRVELGYMHLNFGYLIYLLPLVYLLIVLYRFFSVSERALFLMLALLAIPSVNQKRFCHIMVGIFLIFVGWCLWKILILIDRSRMRLKPLTMLFFLLLMILPGVQYGFYPISSPRDRVDLGTAHLFIKTAQIDQRDVWNRLALNEKPSVGIWANPNMGNILLYTTGYGVVMDNFYHSSTFSLDFDMRTILRTDDFKEKLRNNKVKYLLTADDWQFFELQHSMQGRNASYLRTKQDVNGITMNLFALEELEKYAWVRLVTRDEEAPGFKRLFSNHFNENYFYHFVRGYEFEELNRDLKPKSK